MKGLIKKVALVGDSFYPILDGPTNVMDKYARELTKRGIEVHILAPFTGACDDSSFPYVVHRCKSVNMAFIGYRVAKPNSDKFFVSEQELIDYDIIHCHAPFYVAKYAVKLARKKNIPIICHFHTLFKKDFYKFSHSKLISNCLLKGIMKTFNACTESWSMNNGCKDALYGYGYKGKYREMINATELTALSNIEELKIKLEDMYGLKGCDNVFLFLGRIVKQKNVFFTVEALKILNDKGFNFKMVFAGDGLECEKLKNRVNELGLQNKVVFTGMIRDRDLVGALYARSKLFLFPSTYDTSSLVQIEAAAYSTPTVFLEGAITASAVVDNVNGYTSKPTVEAFAEKIVEICEDSDTYEVVSKNCHEQLYLDWNQIGERVITAYEEIAEEFRTKYGKKVVPTQKQIAKCEKFVAKYKLKHDRMVAKMK